jgi:hypothetical protein
MIKNVYWASCKEYFFERLSKNVQISNFMKIRPVKAELFHADRRTDREDRWKEGQAEVTNLIDAFRNFANAPKWGGGGGTHRKDLTYGLERV